MATPTTLPDAVLQFAQILQAQDMFQVGLLTLLAYDYLITLQDEIELIWHRPWSVASVLFLLNRYVTPLEYAVVVAAFQIKNWPADVCRRFAKYEGAGSTVVVSICQLIMILRVYALYGRNCWVLACLLLVFALQVALCATALSTGIPLDAPLPSGCILIGQTSLYAVLWVGPLVTDACIFALTVCKSKRYLSREDPMPTFDRFLKDGVAYFFVIFSCNLLNVVVYFSATESFKPFFAPFSEVVTSVMVSRIVLSLRGFASSLAEPPAESVGAIDFGSSLAFARSARSAPHPHAATTTMWERVVGNLDDADAGALGMDHDRDHDRDRRARPYAELEAEEGGEIPMADLKTP